MTLDILHEMTWQGYFLYPSQSRKQSERNVLSGSHFVDDHTQISTSKRLMNGHIFVQNILLVVLALLICIQIQFLPFKLDHYPQLLLKRPANQAKNKNHSSPSSSHFTFEHDYCTLPSSVDVDFNVGVADASIGPDVDMDFC